MTDVCFVLPFIQGFGLGAMAACVPGPDILLVTRSSVRYGRTAGLLSTCGIAVALCGYVIATLFLSSTVCQSPPAAFVAMRLAGALYLIYLGSRWLITDVSVSFEVTEAELRSCFWQGFLSAIRNPKLMLWFLAVTSQIVGLQPSLGARGAVLIGLAAGPTVCFASLSLVAGALQSRATPSLTLIFDRIAGVILMMIGFAGIVWR